jgi:hypothetical protein
VQVEAVFVLGHPSIGYSVVYEVRTLLLSC